MFGISLYSFASWLFRKRGVSSLAKLTSVVEIFKDTLAPASLVGLVSKLVGLACSGRIGGLIDRTPRIRFVRATIAIHEVSSLCGGQTAILIVSPWKSSTICCSFVSMTELDGGAFHGLSASAVLSSMSTSASDALRWRASMRDNIVIWGILILTIAIASMTNLTNTGMEVSVERDW